jgi:hypothetical protein
MTSFIIGDHKTRKVAQSWKEDTPFCAFCRIIENGAKAHKVYENQKVIAILGESVCNKSVCRAMLAIISFIVL